MQKCRITGLILCPNLIIECLLFVYHAIIT